MNIQVINKINKEACSMTSLKIGEQEYPLTEKELINLLTQLKYRRDDLFEDLDSVKVTELSDEIDDLRQENVELRADNEDLEWSNQNLRDILDENCIDYDDF